MMHHVLQEGTVLDEHYRIEALLGQGGFGITYLARNIRLDSRVAIKELFWRDHSTRDCAVSPEVALCKREDEAVFSAQKERFLREARMVRDFSDRAEVARVLDYFEANGTAYIVMEYVEGETLSALVERQGPMKPEDAFRRFLPLVEALGYIHGCGVIHRDISPDNIIVQPDGSLKLIDFGAARQFAALGGERYSVIAKDSYAPGEQYNESGKQGPWSDVYSLCATLYSCVTGQPPLGSMLRMYHEELVPPSRLAPGVTPAYERVLLHGMERFTSDRYQSMEELAQAMREALPAPPAEPVPPMPLWKKLLIAACACAVCAALGIGGYALWRTSERPKFAGVATESFVLSAPSGMSVTDFARAQRELNARLDEFAGEDNYIVSVAGAELRAELPLALFEEREIGSVLREAVLEPLSDYGFSLNYQIQVKWEDPTTSLIAGEHQIRPEEFAQDTAVLCYKQLIERDMTAGQRASLLVDFKARLDALGAPYAFGTVYGDANMLALRIDPERIGRYVTESIGASYPLEIAGEGSINSVDISYSRYETGEERQLSVIDNGDGTFGLRYQARGYAIDRLRSLTKYLLDQGHSTLYLQTDHSVPLARCEIQAQIDDGRVEFQEFMFEGMPQIDEEHRYILDYLTALVNDTEMTDSWSLCGEEVWEARDGGTRIDDAEVDDRLGLRTRPKDDVVRLYETLERIEKERGYSWTTLVSSPTPLIQLNLARDEHLIENLNEAFTGLLRDYKLADFELDGRFGFQILDEVDDERYRVFLGTSTRYSAEGYSAYRYATATFAYASDRGGALPPYAQELQAWWEEFPAEEFGITKEAY